MTKATFISAKVWAKGEVCTIPVHCCCKVHSVTHSCGCTERYHVSDAKKDVPAYLRFLAGKSCGNC